MVFLAIEFSFLCAIFVHIFSPSLCWVLYVFLLVDKVSLYILDESFVNYHFTSIFLIIFVLRNVSLFTPKKKDFRFNLPNPSSRKRKLATTRELSFLTYQWQRSVLLHSSLHLLDFKLHKQFTLILLCNAHHLPIS